MRHFFPLLLLFLLAPVSSAQWMVQVTLREGGTPLEGVRVGFVRTEPLASVPPGERVLPDLVATTDANGRVVTALPFPAGERFQVCTLSEVHFNQFWDARDGGREGLPGYPLRGLWSSANLRPLTYNRHHVLAFELRTNRVEDVPLTFSGGVTLLHDIYLARPLEEGPSPLILARSPYSLGSGGAGITAYGYTYVAQETRGRSGGVTNGCPTIFRTDGWDAVQDGYRTLQLLERLTIDDLPVGNGKVGMIGPSALGLNQLLTAGAAAVAGQPSMVSACYADLAPGDLHSLVFPGGILRRETVNWYLQSQYTAPGEARDYCDFCATCSPSEYFQRLRDRDDKDPFGSNGDDAAYWATLDFGAAVRDPGVAVTTPTFLQTGWFDLFVPETVGLFQDLQASGIGRQRLMIGPWTHAGRRSDTQGELVFPGARLPEVNGDPGSLPPAVEDFSSPVRFYDRFVRGFQNGWEGDRDVAYYVMGTDPNGVESNFWRTTDTWPPNDLVINERRLYLFQEGGDGLLRSARPRTRKLGRTLTPRPGLAPERAFAHDPLNDPLVSIGGRLLTLPAGPRDQTPNESFERAGDDGPIVTFTLPAFTRPTEVTGAVTAHLAFAADVPDVDLVVKLTDVHASGEPGVERSILVAQGARRARYRGGDFVPDPPLQPGVFTEMDVELGPISWVFGEGHRLRVSVMASDWPRLERNPQTGGGFHPQPRPIATSRIRLGCEGPPSPRTSWLTLPVVAR